MQQHELLTATERQVRQAVRQAYLDAYGHQYRILAQQRLLDSNRAKLESTRLGRQVGVRSLLEELQAQQAAADAEQQLAQARYGYVLAYMRLLKESGVLGETARQQQLRRELFAAGSRGTNRTSALTNPAVSVVPNPPHTNRETAQRAISVVGDAPPSLDSIPAAGQNAAIPQARQTAPRPAPPPRRSGNRRSLDVNRILLKPN